MDKIKDNNIRLFIGIAVLVVVLIGSTYAYFKNIVGDNKAAKVNVSNYDVDRLSFVIGDELNINVSQSEFSQGKSSVSDNTFAKAILHANNDTNEARMNYNLYLSIQSNDFVYTKNDNPELLLKITDKNGIELTKIDGLSYKEISDANGIKQTGFDITTKFGLITLLNAKEITAHPMNEETWHISLTFINHNFDQSKNAGASFKAKIVIQKDYYKHTNINDLCAVGNNLSECIINLSLNGDPNYTKLYYHNKNLVGGANDNSHRFSGASSTPETYLCQFNGQDVYNIYNLTNNTNQKIGTSFGNDCSTIFNLGGAYADGSIILGQEQVKWDSSSNACLTINKDNIVYDFKNGSVNEKTCKGIAYKIYDNKYYIKSTLPIVGSGTKTFVSPATKGVDNYICLGNTKNPCPNDNLYRIIGVFGDRVKVIKDSFILEKKWDSGNANEEYGSNTWSTSSLNTYLNGSSETGFLSYIESFVDKVDIAKWKVGGGFYNNIVSLDATSAYYNEIKMPNENNTSKTGEIEYEAKIGLMYASDFMYATAQKYWQFPAVYKTSSMDSYKAIEFNWLYKFGDEWLITRESEYNSSVLYRSYDGWIRGANPSDQLSIRPTFYLKSTVKYNGGTGEINNPIFLQ